ncbi:MAG: hypothetical protein JST31_06900 [Actinobacteria bacterium]|nr:hypothetical protein [Actinomycetota bacterium]
MNSATAPPPSHPLHQRVCGSPAAIDAILHLRGQRGELTLHHVGGDECEVEAHGVERPLTAGRTAVCAGIVGGAPFLVDRKRDAALGFPEYEVDVIAPSADEGPDEALEPRLVSRVVTAPGSGD